MCWANNFESQLTIWIVIYVQFVHTEIYLQLNFQMCVKQEIILLTSTCKLKHVNSGVPLMGKPVGLKWCSD